MIRPTSRSIGLSGALLVPALIPMLSEPRYWLIWATALAFLLLAAGIDALLMVAPRQLEVSVRTPPALAIGQQGELTIKVGGRAMNAFRLRLLPEIDERFFEPAAQEVAASDEGDAMATWPLIPRQRGMLALSALWLRWRGPLGLMEATTRVPLDRAVSVTPDIGAVRAMALQFRAEAQRPSLRVERRRGEGSEFDALREHQPGMDSRLVDWKASARHGKLLVREHRAERDRQVILAIDTGRPMSEELEGVPRLDRAINAALLLGHAALRAGDCVGLIAFDQEVRLFQEPAAGITTMRILEHECARLEYATGETNYTLGMTSLATRLRRRSLVVLFTEFVDTVTAELLLDNMRHLARRHLTLFVTLRDPRITTISGAPPRSVEAMNRSVVASELLQDREVVLGKLRRLGITCLDLSAAELAPSLIKQYFEIKRRELV